MWRHFPWLVGLVASPLLLGSVTAEGQVTVGLLFALSTLLLLNELGSGQQASMPGWLKLLAAGLLLVAVIPLPVSLLKACAAGRMELAAQFPLADSQAWLVSGVSPAGAMQRLWEIALLATGFSLARHAAHRRAFPLVYANFVAAGLFLLAASDLWLRHDGGKTILGLWENRWNIAAGTFANRNHFASWIYVGAVFLIGWLLRTAWPLHAARLGGVEQRLRRWPTLLTLALVVVPALFLAVSCGSRAGCLAFGVGLAVWVLLLARRSHNRVRWMVMGGIGLALALLMLGASSFLLERLTAGKEDIGFKASIWKDTLTMVAKFPVLGTGVGGFADAFSHFKHIGAGRTFWHAENEYVQWVAETGWAGGLVWGAVLALLARGVLRHAWNGKVAEPELFFGAIAAVAAFAAHAIFEFVLQIPANALLAATLLGMAVGMVEQARLPQLPPPPPRWRIAVNAFWGGLLAALAVLQAMGFWYWQQGQATGIAAEKVAHYRQSLAWWPWAVERHVPLLRASVVQLQSESRARQLELARGIRAEFIAGLQRSPYNWELRLELAWFDLGFSTNALAACQEAWQAVKLNPLQPQIPLRFARHFAVRDPATAFQFLHAVDYSDGNEDETRRLTGQALEIAWQADRRPDMLWTVTPDTGLGLMTLADFALGKGLSKLAWQACNQASNRVADLERARCFLRAGYPAEATNAIAAIAADPQARLLVIEAALRAGHYAEAIQLGERFWQTSHWKHSLVQPFVRPEELAPQKAADLLARWQANKDDLAAARMLAELHYALPAASRDVALLRALATRFAREPRFWYLVVETEQDRGNLPAAAQAALALAQAVEQTK